MRNCCSYALVQAKLLHGEQYLSIKAPIPVQADLVSEARLVTTIRSRWQRFECHTYRLLEVLDKGKAAAVTSIVQTKDKNSGEVIFENQSTVFIRGSGGFGGKTKGNGSCVQTLLWTRVHIVLLYFTDRGPASAANAPPKRKPDAVAEEKTTTTQAALYR